MIASIAIAGVFAATALSQGRVRFALAGMVLPGLLVFASFQMSMGVGELVVSVVFAAGTAVAWVGVIPAPVSVQCSTAIGSGIAIGLVLTVARLGSRLDPIAAAVIFAVLLYSVEMFSSRSNPFGEWGSLAHSQTRQSWALAVARFGPHAVTLVLALFSGSIGYAAATGWLRPLAVAAAVAIATLVITISWYRDRPDGNKAVGVAGLIEDDDTFFSTYVEGFVNGTLDDAQWAAFDKRSSASLDHLLRRTVDLSGNGTEIVVWAEGAGLVSTDQLEEAVSKAQQAVRSAPCVLVASWMVLDRADGLMSNSVTTITEEGEIVSTVSKAHPVPGLEASRTRTTDSQQVVVDTKLGRLGVAICFDADHHSIWRRLASEDVEIVAIPASDWPAIGALHADMARLRARSIGATVVRPARSGWSMIADSCGRSIIGVDHRGGNGLDLEGHVSKSDHNRPRRRLSQS